MISGNAGTAMIKHGRGIERSMPDLKARWMDRRAGAYFFPDILGKSVALGRGQ
jgi:hypothetical protein